jgi:hypothetical protein
MRSGVANPKTGAVSFDVQVQSFVLAPNFDVLAPNFDVLAPNSDALAPNSGAVRVLVRLWERERYKSFSSEPSPTLASTKRGVTKPLSCR